MPTENEDMENQMIEAARSHYATLPRKKYVMVPKEEYEALRAQLQEQAADLAKARRQIKDLSAELTDRKFEIDWKTRDLAKARRQIEKLEAATFRLYVSVMMDHGMTTKNAEQHAREALEAIRGGKA